MNSKSKRLKLRDRIKLMESAINHEKYATLRAREITQRFADSLLKQEQQEAIKELTDIGFSNHQIGKILAIPRSTVQYQQKICGLLDNSEAA